MNILNRIFDSVDHILIFIAKLLLSAMVIIVSTNVFMRYVLNSGIRWAEEISLVCVVWFTFIALAHGVKEKLHINMNLLPANVIRKFYKFFIVSSNIIIFIVGYTMIYYGIKLVEVTSRSILPASNLPAAVLYFPLILSGILIIFNVMVDFLKLFRHREVQS